MAPTTQQEVTTLTPTELQLHSQNQHGSNFRQSFYLKLPHPVIPPIKGLPIYKTITDVTRLINANSAPIHSELGDGQLGHLALTILPAVYATLSAIPFIASPNPGPVPVLVPNVGTKSPDPRHHPRPQRVTSALERVQQCRCGAQATAHPNHRLTPHLNPPASPHRICQRRNMPTHPTPADYVWQHHPNRYCPQRQQNQNRL
jgi:hypothetical protein